MPRVVVPPSVGDRNKRMASQVSSNNIVHDQNPSTTSNKHQVTSKGGGKGTKGDVARKSVLVAAPNKQEERQDLSCDIKNYDALKQGNKSNDGTIKKMTYSDFVDPPKPKWVRPGDRMTMQKSSNNSAEYGSALRAVSVEDEEDSVVDGKDIEEGEEEELIEIQKKSPKVSIKRPAKYCNNTMCIIVVMSALLSAVVLSGVGLWAYMQNKEVKGLRRLVRELHGDEDGDLHEVEGHKKAPGTVKQLEKRFAEAKAQVAKFQNETSENFQKTFTKLDDLHDDMMDEFSEVKKQLAENFEKVCKELDKKLDTDVFQKAVSEIKSDLSKKLDTKDFHETIDPMKATIDNMDTKIGEIDTKVDKIDTKVGEIDTKVGEIKTDLGKMDMKMDKMDKKMDKMDKKVDKMDAKMDDMDKNQKELKAEIERVRAEIMNEFSKQRKYPPPNIEVLMQEKLLDAVQNNPLLENVVSQIEELRKRVEKDVRDIRANTDALGVKTDALGVKTDALTESHDLLHKKVDQLLLTRKLIK